MVVFLIKFWRESLILLLIISWSCTTWYLKNDNNQLLSKAEQLKREVREVRGYLSAQNMIIENNRANYEIAINRLPMVLKSIDTKYKTEVVTIEKWRDQNETHDCNSSMQYLNAFVF